MRRYRPCSGWLYGTPSVGSVAAKPSIWSTRATTTGVSILFDADASCVRAAAMAALRAAVCVGVAAGMASAATIALS